MWHDQGMVSPRENSGKHPLGSGKSLQFLQPISLVINFLASLDRFLGRCYYPYSE